MRRCPFDKKECKTDCVLYRKGVRVFENPTPGQEKYVPFEECAINIGVDCLENMISRSIGQQKASEETRNEVSKLNELFNLLSGVKQLTQNREEVIEVEPN